MTTAADVDRAVSTAASRARTGLRASDRRVERVTRLGWAAKGLVYTLMGLAAFAISQQQRRERTDEQASPAGAFARVLEQPGGRLLLALVGVGLVLYVAWRMISIVLIAGTDPTDWLDRLGYAVSAAFYATLAWTALRSAVGGDEPEDGNSIERISRRLLDTDITRALLVVAGIVALGVAGYFVVRKALLRSFTDDLDGVEADWAANDRVGRALLVGGMIGWSGRGIVTALVGFFVTRAAITYDASDARGLDRALQQVATTPLGTALVAVTAFGLVVYGLFCLASVPRRTLEVER